MKRLFSWFRRKPTYKFFHINYSDIYYNGHNYYLVASIRSLDGVLLGQYYYFITKFGAVLKNLYSGKMYFLAKTPKDDLAAADGWINPEFGSLYNAHSLTNFLKLEFGL